MQNLTESIKTTLAEFPVVICTEQRLGFTPKDGLIFNATRPLPGDFTNQGEFMHGIFYATITESVNYLPEIKNLDGWLIVIKTQEEITELVSKWFVDHNPEYNEALQEMKVTDPEQVVDFLESQHNAMCGLTLQEISQYI